MRRAQALFAQTGLEQRTLPAGQRAAHGPAYRTTHGATDSPTNRSTYSAADGPTYCSADSPTHGGDTQKVVLHGNTPLC